MNAFRQLSPEAQRAALAGPAAPAWIEALARYGLVEAQVLLGQLHLEGRARGRVPGSAFGWFAAAASAGYAPGINMQGRLEQGWDVAPDPAAACACFRRAAALDLDWAQYNLGNALLYGNGTARDLAAAYTWFVRAADQGLAKAMNMLGRFHEEGWNRPRNRSEAARYYRAAAAGGDFRGQFNLASLLQRQGRLAEAASWLGAAIVRGSPDFLADVSHLLAANDDPDLRAIGQLAKQRLLTHFTPEHQ